MANTKIGPVNRGRGGRWVLFDMLHSCQALSRSFCRKCSALPASFAHVWPGRQRAAQHGSPVLLVQEKICREDLTS
jgi:hypothetical protein